MGAAKRERDEDVVVVKIFGAGCEHVFVNKIKQVVRSAFVLPASSTSTEKGKYFPRNRIRRSLKTRSLCVERTNEMRGAAEESYAK